MQMADIFRTRIIDVSQDSVIAEVTGDEENRSFIEMVKPSV